ncbi:MAG TPA: hypothetical protein VGB83_10360 [Actinomycetota bacterium]
MSEDALDGRSIIPDGGLFGLWDLLAACEEVASLALLDRPIDPDVLRLRISVFRPQEMPEARHTLQILILAVAEIREMLHEIGAVEASAPTPWPPEGPDLDDAVGAAIAGADALALPSPAGGAGAPATAGQFLTRALGFVAGVISLADAALELSVRWLDDNLSGLDRERRELVREAVDVVFWAAAVLLATIERELGPSDSEG